jgi:hypothetical protein
MHTKTTIYLTAASQLCLWTAITKFWWTKNAIGGGEFLFLLSLSIFLLIYAATYAPTLSKVLFSLGIFFLICSLILSPAFDSTSAGALIFSLMTCLGVMFAWLKI